MSATAVFLVDQEAAGTSRKRLLIIKSCSDDTCVDVLNGGHSSSRKKPLLLLVRLIVPGLTMMSNFNCFALLLKK